MRRLLLAAAAGVLLAAPLAAQSTRLTVLLPPEGRRAREAPYVQSTGVLGDPRVRELLVSGFPARLRFRLELWSRRGWFDNVAARVDWDVIVRFSPLDRSYTAVRLVGDRVTPLGTFARLDGMEEALAAPFRPPISLPRGRGRYYYAAVLDIQMISASDLDEVERWLRGELRPAVQGRRNAGTALGRGVGTLLTRLLGGADLRVQGRTGVFRPE